MTRLSDRAVGHLRVLLDRPALEGARYELGEELGRGGMGRVYRARDTELDRDVALKVPDDVDMPESVLRRLLAEARILARLEHPGIVPVHDVGRLADGRVFYTMKLVRGERLDGYARRGATRAELLRVFERVCEAVAFAHSHGVVHRDLKPENVMIGAYGEVLVLDWGVAKLLRDGATAAGERAVGAPGGDREVGSSASARGGEAAGAPSTSAGRLRGTDPGTVLGTPGYMAPEQAAGDTSRTDERADVYGLGAILHFLLVGRPPAAGGAEVPALRRLRPGIPRSLEAICRRALEPEPAARYASVQELADDVARHLTGQPVRAHRETVLERAGRVLSRHRTVALLVLAYLLMRVAFLAFGGL